MGSWGKWGKGPWELTVLFLQLLVSLEVSQNGKKKIKEHCLGATWLNLIFFAVKKNNNNKVKNVSGARPICVM